MEDNPYSALAELFGDKGPRLMMFQGRVGKTAPLTVVVENIELSGGDLMINAALLQHTAEIDGPGDPFQANIMPELNVGDELLLLTVDMQIFYVLCKVVSA